MTSEEIQARRKERFIANLKAIHIDLLNLKNSSSGPASNLVAEADEAVQRDILIG